MYGRFIPEILRTVQALQIADCTKNSTAANWIPYQPVILPIPKTFEELQERNREIEENRNGINWYLSFRNIPENCLRENNDECHDRILETEKKAEETEKKNQIKNI